MGRKIVEKKKAFFMQRFTYDEEFQPELELFFLNIQKDKRLDKENKNLDKSRFSRAIRMLIKSYNSWFNNKLKQEGK